MPFDQRVRLILLSGVIFIVGLIHFAVGVAIAGKYHMFGDVFQQQLALAGFTAFVGVCAIIISIIGLVSDLRAYSLLSKITTIAAFILGFMAFTSLITALVLNSQSPGYLRDRLTDHMNEYAQDDDSFAIINNLQTTYECCGVNLWLDWANVALGANSGAVFGRRRRYSYLLPSPLTRALRQKRQIVTSGSTVYNLPSSYTFLLPLSCCKTGATAVGNSLGGYCLFDPNNGTNSFYLSGCLVPVANIGVSEITGIAVINSWLTIFSFLYFAKFFNLFPNNTNSNNSNDKKPAETGINQPQLQQQGEQYPYGQYYVSNYNSNPYYTYNNPIYKTYL